MVRAMKKKPAKNTGAVCIVCGGAPKSMGVVADAHNRPHLAHSNVCLGIWNDVRAEAQRAGLDPDEAEAWMKEELARLLIKYSERIAEQFMSTSEIADRHLGPRKTENIRVGKPPEMGRRLDGHR